MVDTISVLHELQALVIEPQDFKIIVPESL